MCPFEPTHRGPLRQLVNRTGLPIVVGQKWTASSVTLIGGQQPPAAGSCADPDAMLREAVVAVAGGPGRGGAGGGSGGGTDLLAVLTGDCPEAAPRIFSLGPKARARPFRPLHISYRARTHIFKCTAALPVTVEGG
jgi:hypothetical protein